MINFKNKFKKITMKTNTKTNLLRSEVDKTAAQKAQIQQQIKNLREGFGKIEEMNPSSSLVKKLSDYLTKLEPSTLLQIEKAEIKFVSKLARAKLVSKGFYKNI